MGIYSGTVERGGTYVVKKEGECLYCSKRKEYLNVRGNPEPHIYRGMSPLRPGRVLLLCPNLTLYTPGRAWQRAEMVLFEVWHVVFGHTLVHCL